MVRQRIHLCFWGFLIYAAVERISAFTTTGLLAVPCGLERSRSLVTHTWGYAKHPQSYSRVSCCTRQKLKLEDEDGDAETSSAKQSEALSTVLASPARNILFSILITICGAALGPFLDSYHSAFGVLQYEQPLTAALWGSVEHPALITAWWVPELFGLAGFIIGWLNILLDAYLAPSFKQETSSYPPMPTAPRIFVGISLFTMQYWLSGVLSQLHIDRTTILNVMSTIAGFGFYVLDGTFAGFLTSAATAAGGPLIEVGLLSLSRAGYFGGTGYQYLDLGETGFFPLWIVPVYFLGGPAVGNLARGIWNQLGEILAIEPPVIEGISEAKPLPGCTVCNDTRRVPCPNCDGVGSYVAMGGRTIQCTSCRGRGFVICRSCFSYYDEDPNDIDAIRDTMSRMPD